ncbi:MAG: hypothetical protein Kow00123_22750 [Anaerolineales bacterium]
MLEAGNAMRFRSPLTIAIAGERSALALTTWPVIASEAKPSQAPSVMLSEAKHLVGEILRGFAAQNDSLRGLLRGFAPRNDTQSVMLSEAKHLGWRDSSRLRRSE